MQIWHLKKVILFVCLIMKERSSLSSLLKHIAMLNFLTHTKQHSHV